MPLFLLLSLQDVVGDIVLCPQGDALGYGNHWAFSPPLLVVLLAHHCLFGYTTHNCLFGY